MQRFRAESHALANLGVEVAQQLLGRGDALSGSAQADLVPARADCDAESVLDLAQVAVQMPGQHRQMTRVIRFQREGLLGQLSR